MTDSHYLDGPVKSTKSLDFAILRTFLRKSASSRTSFSEQKEDTTLGINDSVFWNYLVNTKKEGYLVLSVLLLHLYRHVYSFQQGISIYFDNFNNFSQSVFY